MSSFSGTFDRSPRHSKRSSVNCFGSSNPHCSLLGSSVLLHGLRWDCSLSIELEFASIREAIYVSPSDEYHELQCMVSTVIVSSDGPEGMSVHSLCVA